MANWIEPPEGAEAEWLEWVAGLPAAVATVAARFRPWRLYRMRSSQDRCTVVSFANPDAQGKVTMTVEITGEFNVTVFDREVFGVDPDELEECDLPGPHEAIGTLLTDPDAVKGYIDQVRPIVLAARTADPDDPYGKPTH